MYCRVVLRDSTRAFDREYTYAIPAALTDQVSIGSWIEIPFGNGNRPVQAFVLAVESSVDTDFYVKPLIRLLSERPVLRLDQLQLASQMRARYGCTYGDALRLMVPSAVSAVGDKIVRMVELIDPAEAARRLEDGEIDRLGHQRVIELLLEYGAAPVPEVLHACQISRAILKTLEKKELIRYFQQEIRRSGGEEPAYEQLDDFPPNPDQQQAIERIREALVAAGEIQHVQEFLLFGITGSGKTEVYLQTAKHATSLGRGVIILVPEISLTPQMVARIRSRFGSGAAVLHSRLTPSERYEQWQRILRQEVSVVVGARSAIFAPLINVGLIIIDEEQESTYKSETHPRYHARDIARKRAKICDAVIVLGSATPAVESFYRAQTGQTTLLRLNERIGKSRLPDTRIVDMRQELREGNRSVFSRDLTLALRRAIAAGNQGMLFINRRGMAGFMLCRDCGHVVKCKTCSVSLTSHLRPGSMPGQEQYQLVCHYCGKISHPPATCPVCGSERIGRFGAGTQQVEKSFNETFAPATALRMDQDTTTGRQSHAQILDQFASHQADVLIGTQMIAKGHDFPNVTVVGILSADLMLGMSDFRASERAFSLITQAAGRAGRGEAAGEVLIQAYNTDDYAILAAAEQNYEQFYLQEIAFRKAMRYPPFGVLGLLLLSGPNERTVREKMQHIHGVLTTRLAEDASQRGIPTEIELLEPGRAPIFLLRGRFRYRLIIKAQQAADLMNFLNTALNRFDYGQTAVTIDVDPYSML
ncbi:MAG: primosomal protein N' [Eubacteriales bacterium]|nr:primosomal protein N' [Eubacteriales bacterium]